MSPHLPSGEDYNTMRNILLPLFIAASPTLALSQYLTGIASYYNDSFVEWRFFTDDPDESLEGVLKLTWQLSNDDWTAWDYRLGELFGEIKMKWKDQPDQWELRGNNLIITARTIWRDDFREWRISDGSINLNFKTKWGNSRDEWELKDARLGSFSIYTNFEGDPRDWIIADETLPDLPFELKLMMAFIAVFNSSPRQ